MMQISMEHSAQLIEIFDEISNEISIDIIDRVLGGKVNFNDALTLLECDPSTIFKFADQLRSILVGNTVTYIVNRNINFSDQ